MPTAARRFSLWEKLSLTMCKGMFFIFKTYGSDTNTQTVEMSLRKHEALSQEARGLTTLPNAYLDIWFDGVTVNVLHVAADHIYYLVPHLPELRAKQALLVIKRRP
jgi:hypothetical protein